MTIERRNSPRAILVGEAKVFFANETLACRLLDISDSGMALAVSSQQTPPSSLRIQFTLPEQPLPVSVDAILVRHRSCGSEVEWGVRLLSPLAEVVREVAPESSTAYRINHAKEWLLELEESLAGAEGKPDVLSEELQAELGSRQLRGQPRTPMPSTPKWRWVPPRSREAPLPGRSREWATGRKNRD